MNKTINYYNKNAETFIQDTISVNLTATQDKFLNKLPSGATILDFGCGSGRDTKYFIEQGFMVEATDGSIEFCERASELTGIKVTHALFQELNELEKYDGIWACSSILHLSKEELRDVFGKMIRAIKATGVIYTSFKYGEFEGERNGRYFIDFTDATFQKFMEEFPEIRIEEQWITGDARPNRGDEKWLNIILRKA